MITSEHIIDFIGGIIIAILTIDLGHNLAVMSVIVGGLVGQLIHFVRFREFKITGWLAVMLGGLGFIQLYYWW